MVVFLFVLRIGQAGSLRQDCIESSDGPLYYRLKEGPDIVMIET